MHFLTCLPQVSVLLLLSRSPVNCRTKVPLATEEKLFKGRRKARNIRPWQVCGASFPNVPSDQRMRYISRSCYTPRDALSAARFLESIKADKQQNSVPICHYIQCLTDYPANILPRWPSRGIWFVKRDDFIVMSRKHRAMSDKWKIGRWN